MNFQQLEHFLVLVETQSFVKAADKLHLTQPALSRSIQALESALGGRLIERDKRKTLTPLGELAIRRARRIRLELAELRRSAESLQTFAAGTLHLGLGPAPAALLSLPLLRRLIHQYPAIKAVLSGGTPEMQMEELREGSLDAAIFHRNHLPVDENIKVELFAPSPLGFVCRAGHPLVDKGRLSFDALRRYPVAASGRAISADISHRLNSHFGNGTHFTDIIHYQANDVPTLLELVRDSDAVFFGVVQMASSQLASGEFVELSLSPTIALHSQFAFVTLQSETEPPILQVIRKLCAEIIGGT